MNMSDSVENRRSGMDSGRAIKKFKSAVKLVRIADDIQSYGSGAIQRERKSDQADLEARLETMLTRGSDTEGNPEAMRRLGVLHPEEYKPPIASVTRSRLMSVAAVEPQNFILITNRDFEMVNGQPEFGYEVSNTVSFWTVGPDHTYQQSFAFPALQPGHTLLYVHGFWNSVNSAVTAASVVGPALQGANVTNVICFSWPSQNSPVHYNQDVENQKESVPVLMELFYAVEKARINSMDRLHLVAHSLGNRLSTAALITVFKIHKEPIRDDLFGSLFFCAADVDINTAGNQDGFQDFLSKISEHAENVTSYACDSDAALEISTSILYNGVYRGGRFAPVACSDTNDYTTLLWRGRTTVDPLVSHNSFKEPVVMDDMKRAIAYDETRHNYWRTVTTGASVGEPQHNAQYYADHEVYFIHT